MKTINKVKAVVESKTKSVFDFFSLVVTHRQGPLVLAIGGVLIISYVHSPLALHLLN